jgi:hypothetical protein
MIFFFVVAAANGEMTTLQPQTALSAADSSAALKLPLVDTAASSTSKPAVDSSRATFGGRSDSTLLPAGVKTPKDSTRSVEKQAALPNEPQKMKLLKRKYNGRHQLIFAVFMMIFVIGIITMAQQWNPR